MEKKKTQHEMMKAWDDRQRYLGQTYSSFEIMRALHIEKEKLRDWIERGFIRATTPSPGRGKPAAFTVKDIYGLALFMELINYGFSRERASHLADTYRYSIEVDINEPDDDGILEELIVLDDQYAADFILFHRKTDFDGNPIITARTITNDKVKISLRSGWPEYIKPEVERQTGFAKDWDSLLIINYGKIRNRVDEALRKL